MWLIHEIELHDDVFWCLYHVSTNICEIGAMLCKKCWLRVGFELKNTIWETQNFDVRSSGVMAARAENTCSQYFLQTWCPLERDISRSSGKLL